jgi:hypothetical protein
MEFKLRIIGGPVVWAVELVGEGEGESVMLHSFNDIGMMEEYVCRLNALTGFDCVTHTGEPYKWSWQS